MKDFKQFRRSQIAEMREVTELDINVFKNHGFIHISEYPFGHNISISDADKNNGSPKIGDMIARNPKDYSDQWLVAEQYFKDNFEQRFDLEVSERPFADWKTIELYLENMGVLKNEPKKQSRCCGRCDGVNDICHADRICEKHTEIGCEICFGER